MSKQLIIQTTVEKRENINANSGNEYVSESALNNIFLLSINDLLNSDYGFSSASKNDSARRLKSSAYALCQGIANSNRLGWWWLRSPYGSDGVDVYCVSYDGNVDFGNDVNYTSYGVVPAMQIRL